TLPTIVPQTSSFCALCFSSFFFYCSRHHRPLPSFPTRRSSDLCAAQAVSAWYCDSRRHRPHTADEHSTRDRPSGCGRNDHCRKRSEEHTSELQSRSDLVCRLLLEKKKKNKKTTRTNNIFRDSRI